MDWVTPTIGLAGALAGATATYLAPRAAERIKRNSEQERLTREQERTAQADLRQLVDDALTAATRIRNTGAYWTNDLEHFIYTLDLRDREPDVEAFDQAMRDDEGQFREAMGDVLRSIGLYVGSAAAASELVNDRPKRAELHIDRSDWTPADNRRTAFVKQMRMIIEATRVAMLIRSQEGSPNDAVRYADLVAMLKEAVEARRALDFKILQTIMRKYGYVALRT